MFWNLKRKDQQKEGNHRNCGWLKRLKCADPSRATRTLCSLKEDSKLHLAFVLAHIKGDRNQAAQILGVS